eukprot:UN04247
MSWFSLLSLFFFFHTSFGSDPFWCPPKCYCGSHCYQFRCYDICFQTNQVCDYGLDECVDPPVDDNVDSGSSGSYGSFMNFGSILFIFGCVFGSCFTVWIIYIISKKKSQKRNLRLMSIKGDDHEAE